MTSRFGKTYSRRAGDGSSKFDEVLSNKRATLSTKWGETTYKARVVSKRPGVKADQAADRTKRPKFTVGGASEDPFGYDSDDESRPVTSRGSAQHKPRPTLSLRLEPNSRVQQPVSAVALSRSSASSSGAAALSRSSSSSGAAALSHSSSSSGAAALSRSSSSSDPHSYSWYRSPSESDTLTRTAALKSDHKDSYDPWSAVVGVADPLWRRDEPLQPPADTRLDPPAQGLWDVPDEPQSVLRASHCRTYCRPSKGKHPGGADGSRSSSPHGATPTPQSGAAGGRGRARDFTVLHPSSVSMSNVTIRHSLDRSVEETYTPPAPPTAVPLESSRLKKKTETLGPPHSSRLELFGFDGAPEDSADAAAGSSGYRVKYFGFDELSESDGEGEEEEEEEEEGWSERRRVSAAGSPQTNVDAPPAKEKRSGRSHDAPPSHHFPCPSLSETRRPQVKVQEKAKESRKIFSGPKKSPTKAVYNARHWNRPEPEELPPTAPPRSQPSAVSTSGNKESNSHKDDGVFKAPAPPPKVTKSVTVPTEPYQDMVTALKCRKEHKELFTVVQHVKHFNDVVEFGENQEFLDDFEYLAAGLKAGQPLNTRCLSVISLATRCALPGFRMHLRACGKVAHVFKTISDAPQHPNLALCTASLMYILSRDRLNMDLDRASLDLMIRLLELEQDTAREMGKVKEKIRKLCETVHNKHLDLENITTGHLAMETLLSLTSKRAGDWFKEELRLLGGLDHIVDKVKECVESLRREDEEENLVASLWSSERCLRVLESVTRHNLENQTYLIAYKDSQLIASSARALRRCEELIQRHSRVTGVAGGGASGGVGRAVEDCMRAVIGVLLSLSLDNEWGSTKTGEQEGLMDTALQCVLRVPQFLPPEKRFDIRVLGLGLLINLVEYSARNRHALVELQVGVAVWEALGVELRARGGVIAALVQVSCAPGGVWAGPSSHATPPQLFLQREHAAVLAEAETDDFINDAPKPQPDQSGEWRETSGEIQWVAAENHCAGEEKKKEEDEELDLNKVLQHAGKHMEDSIVASYTALLLGCLCQGSPMNVTTVRENLPKGDFSVMTEMLKKFLNFMNLTMSLTCDASASGLKSISRVIEYLEHC